MRAKYLRFVAAIIVLAIVLFAASCDSMSRSGTIKAAALFSGNVLELPVSNTANWGDYAAWKGLVFKSKKNMEKLSNEMMMQGASVFAVNAYSDSTILFHQQNDADTSDDYCIRLLEADGANSKYVFSGMEAKVATSQNTAFSMLLPIHLISDQRINRSVISEINLGAEYETFEYWGEDYDCQDVLDLFYSFYDESGWYDLEKGDHYLIINGYKSGLENRIDSRLVLPSPVKISFVKHVNLVYFIISFVE